MESILIIEDGSGVENANSYATAAQARAYALLRGITLPVVPAEGQDPVEEWLISATDYLESLAFIGYIASAAQGLQWPRVLTHPYLNYPFLVTNVPPYVVPVDPSFYVLPAKVKTAQCQLVIEQAINNVVLQPTTVGGYASQFITREKTDVLETNYSEKLGTLATPTMLIVNSLLRGLVIKGGGTTSVNAVRV